MGEFTEAQLLRQIDRLTDELAHEQTVSAQLRENARGNAAFWEARDQDQLRHIARLETQIANLKMELDYYKARSLPPDCGGDVTMLGETVLRPKDGG